MLCFSKHYIKFNISTIPLTLVCGDYIYFYIILTFVYIINDVVIQCLKILKFGPRYTNSEDPLIIARFEHRRGKEFRKELESMKKNIVIQKSLHRQASNAAFWKLHLRDNSFPWFKRSYIVTLHQMRLSQIAKQTNDKTLYI